MAKYKPSAEEIQNDPSMRWCPYRRFETVWSDAHQAELRFVRYAKDGRVVLASLNGCAELPGSVDKLTVRRRSVMDQPRATLSQGEKAAVAAAAKMISNLRKGE